MQDTVDSVKQNGVVVPAIVRPRSEGGYEIVAGHRRKLASERAGFTDMPCIVRNLPDDEAIIQLVDSNAQREDVLPSERAKAYKMRLEAIKRTAGRPPRQAQENAPNNSANFRSDDEVGNVDGISGDTVRISHFIVAAEIRRIIRRIFLCLSWRPSRRALDGLQPHLVCESLFTGKDSSSLEV